MKTKTYSYSEIQIVSRILLNQCQSDNVIYHRTFTNTTESIKVTIINHLSLITIVNDIATLDI